MAVSIYQRAQRHLQGRDQVLGKLIREVGPCTLKHDPDGFAVLTRAIVSQQISTLAARSIIQRLAQSLGSQGISPEAVAKASPAKLRRAGLSAAKERSLRELAKKCLRRQIDLEELLAVSDEEVMGRLLPLRGIGPWTAEMFLIFCLGRPDVLPVADHGLRSGVQKHYGLPHLPARDKLLTIAEPWRPFRSIATWFIWRSLGNVPQS